jgi:hypothetical protein
MFGKSSYQQCYQLLHWVIVIVIRYLLAFWNWMNENNFFVGRESDMIYINTLSDVSWEMKLRERHSYFHDKNNNCIALSLLYLLLTASTSIYYHLRSSVSFSIASQCHCQPASQYCINFPYTNKFQISLYYHSQCMQYIRRSIILITLSVHMFNFIFLIIKHIGVIIKHWSFFIFSHDNYIIFLILY